MRISLSPRASSERGSALVTVLVFVFIMGIFIGAVHTYTLATADLTAAQGEFLRANAAANAAVEVVTGRLAQWVTANSGYGPSIHDCATAGVPGNASFPAITSAITFPAASSLSDFTVSTPQVYPVLPDDSYVTSSVYNASTNPNAAAFLPDVSARQNVSENSTASVTRYYFTHSPTQNAPNVPSRSMTYQISVTVTPKLNSLVIRQPTAITRYIRCDKVSPFNWCTYRNGSATYWGGSTYSGPMYLANSVTFNGPSYTDSVLYGISATNNSSTFTSGGYGAQVKQSSLLSLVPNLVNNMATDSNGNRQASFETSTTPLSTGAPLPSDIFSSRELIEPPTNPTNDTTPAVFKDARIYNQADVRIKVQVTTVGSTKTVSKTVVNIDGTAVNAVTNPWVTPLLNAINVNTAAAGSSSAFVDRSRSTSTSIESTDVNVGAMGTVMAANPTAFPTGIVYVWDATGLDGSTARPLTGVRLWNAGVLPTGGLVVGTNDPVYLKGDFNTGATLPANATVSTAPTLTPSSDTMGRSSTPTTDAQRTVAGYTIQPAGVFGDSITELSNAWQDANSANSSYASSTTINLVEGWSTMSPSELRSDDTYLDPYGKANPVWIEDWSWARRTMSGEEFVVWHSKYGNNTNQGVGGNWAGDISFNTKAASIKLNWGTVNFVRDRAIRTL